MLTFALKCEVLAQASFAFQIHLIDMRIIATVTNDLNYDQRMQRICASLQGAGYDVLLVGRQMAQSKPLTPQVFATKRLHCIWNKGPLFYAEYNLRLFFFLLSQAFDAVNIVDLDTMPAAYLAAWIKNKKRVYDAHEYFTEVPEVTNRPFVKAFWHQIAKWTIPGCHAAYTVGPKLAEELTKVYGKAFSVVRNVPFAYKKTRMPTPPDLPGIPYLFYQGALNQGRGLEQMIDVMASLDHLMLLIAGEGDLSAELRKRVKEKGLEQKVRFLGFLLPSELDTYTQSAWLGLNLLEQNGLSYYYSLANKCFDYIQAGVPALHMDFPEYRAIVEKYPVGLLMSNLDAALIAKTIQDLQGNEKAHRTMRQACHLAAEEYCWEKEGEQLLSTWLIVFTASNTV